MEKNITISLLATLFLTVSPVNAKGSPTDVVGRNLDIPGAGWTGHVGIITDDKVTDSGKYVVEALWEPLVLQINTLSNFKSRSPFWGAKYGINNNNNSGTKIIMEGAFQTSLKCAEYTLSVYYKPGTGQWGAPYTCPKFRCDTFVNYLYWWGGYQLPTYNPPDTAGNATIPLYVFNAFPYSRNNVLHAETKQESTKIFIPIKEPISINTATAYQLASLTEEEFHKVVDMPIKDITTKGVRKILNYSDSSILSYEKKLFLLDKLGFIVTPSMLQKLIKLYYKNKEDEILSRIIIRDTQDLYQQNALLSNYPKEKQWLIDFYSKLLDTQISNQILPIVTRGYIALNSPSDVLENYQKIDNLLNNADLDSSVLLSLKIALLFKSNELEKLYVNNIIAQLTKANSAELDILFYGAVAAQLGNKGLNSMTRESKTLLSNYLNSIMYKFNSEPIVKSNTEYIYPQTRGISLEALALLNASSFEDAAKYISVFLSQLNLEKQEQYVLGLSNNRYLKEAFNNDPFLKQFKNHHMQLYQETVGLIRH